MQKQDLEPYIDQVCLLFKKDGERLKGRLTKITEGTLHLQTYENLRIISMDTISEIKMSLNGGTK